MNGCERVADWIAGGSLNIDLAVRAIRKSQRALLVVITTSSSDQPDTAFRSAVIGTRGITRITSKRANLFESPVDLLKRGQWNKDVVRYAP